MSAAPTPSKGDRLNSWKEIAAYLERDVRTAMRWEKERGLPVCRVPGKRSSVYAFTSEVDVWLHAEAAQRRNGDLVAFAPPATQTAPKRVSPKLLALIALPLTAIATFLLIVATRAHDPQLRNPQPVTNDGLLKAGAMVIDGGSVIFMRAAGESWEIVRSPAPGESPSVIFRSQQPFVLNGRFPGSPDLQVLLTSPMSCRLTPLLVQLGSGSTRNLGDICASSAAWSTDGKRLAYAVGPDLYLADPTASNARKLATLPGRVGDLIWAPDGRRFRFRVWPNPQAAFGRLYEVAIQGLRARPVLPGWSEGPADSEQEGQWTPDGRYFVFSAEHGGNRGLWTIRERGTYGVATPIPTRLITDASGLTQPTPSPDGKKLYAFVQAQDRGELVRCEQKTQLYVAWPAMPGLSAGHVAFAPTNREVAYVTYPNLNLWKMKTDGSSRQQLTTGQSKAALPQWSPDGRQIAYMGWTGGALAPSKIRIMSADGGAFREPVNWPGWQGVPTWSPDGEELIFGENAYSFPIPQSCCLHRFAFKTGRTTDLPNTTGLWTARMSPTGRYIAAETRDKHSLVLYDLRRAHWEELASFPDSDVGDNPNWSKDGKYIYIDAPKSLDPAIYRIRIADKHRDRVASLNNIKRANMDYWLGLTPDGSFLITRRVQASEIYAWDWVAP